MEIGFTPWMTEFEVDVNDKNINLERIQSRRKERENRKKDRKEKRKNRNEKKKKNKPAMAKSDPTGSLEWPGQSTRATACVVLDAGSHAMRG